MSEARVQHNEEGKIQYYVMTGKLIFPAINMPNFKFKKEGIWETYLVPDDSKELEVANNLGIKTKSWEDIPESIYLKRWTQLKNGSSNKPVEVQNAAGQKFEFTDESGREKVIGNNTEAKIMYHYLPIKNSYGTFHTYVLDKVKILNLVEKQDASSNLDEELDF